MVRTPGEPLEATEFKCGDMADDGEHDVECVVVVCECFLEEAVALDVRHHVFDTVAHVLV